MTTATAAPPSGRAVLTALAALVERHPDLDCDPAEVAELLDEVTRIVRRARGRLRTYAHSVAEAEEGESVGKPTPPAPGPGPAAPAAVPAPTPQPSTATAQDSGKPAAAPESSATTPRPPVVSAVAGRPAAEPTPAVIATPLITSAAPRWRALAAAALPWLPLLLLLLGVLAAVVLGASWSTTAAMAATCPIVLRHRPTWTTSGHPT